MVNVELEKRFLTTVMFYCFAVQHVCDVEEGTQGIKRKANLSANNMKIN